MVMIMCLYIMYTIPDAPIDNVDHNGEIKLLLTPQQSLGDEEDSRGESDTSNYDLSKPLITAASLHVKQTHSDVPNSYTNSPGSTSGEDCYC